MSCPWLPAKPAVVQHAGHKGLQLKLAAEIGFKIPPTLITNNPSDLLEFYRKHNGNIISKLASGSFSDTYGCDYARYTEIVGRRDVARMHDLVYCPMIFQAYVPKRVELRITVVGDRVFAAEIHSQSSNHTKLDWRHYDEYQTPYLVHDLPANVERYCISLTRELGLRYGAIDMIVTADERYVFLEINPNGQYLWIENETGLPITSAICDELENDIYSGDHLTLEVGA
jgi:glutathione synthase/RimK-type ligase-like ATP-grasp enzyme